MNKPNLPTEDLPSSMGTYLSVAVLSIVRPRYSVFGSKSNPSSGILTGDAVFFSLAFEFDSICEALGSLAVRIESKYFRFGAVLDRSIVQSIE